MLVAGEVVDRFQIVELLGAGGIAEVYKARHRVLGSLHALKVVTAGGASVARRLLREGSIQAQLRHPNVVAVTDVIEVHGHTALVLEYVEGVTLQQLLVQKGPLPLDEALALYAQILAGVAAAHAAGVLHRDLKPANVLLTPGPAGVLAKVADFGLAKVVLDDAPAEPGDTMQGLAMGTPGYMAPEQIGEAGTADARADVFALGVVLYEMLSGEQPFRGDDITATLLNTLRANPRALEELVPGLPDGVVATVARCLGQDRRDRFADARELARALYGDHRELAEIVEGSRPAVPLAISLPSMAPLRAAGVGSAAAPGPANPTLGPAGFGESLPGEAGGAASASAGAYGSTAGGRTAGAPPSTSGGLGAADTLLRGGQTLGVGSEAPPPGGDAPVEPPAGESPWAAAREAAPRPSRRWLLTGFGLFAGFGLVAGLGVVVFVAGGLGEPAAERMADRSSVAANPASEALPAPVGGAPAAADPTAAAPVAEAGVAAAPVAEAPADAEATMAAAAPGTPAASGAVARVEPREAPGAAVPTGRSDATSASTAGAGAAPAAVAATTTAPTAEEAPAADAAPTGAKDAPAAVTAEAEPVVADAAPVSEPTRPAASASPAGAPVAGTWKGAWDGRPFTLTLAPEGADRVGARLEVLVGTSYRTFRLSGPVDAAGRFTLTEEGNGGWWLEGALSGANLAGSIRAPEAKKASAFTAKRR